MCDVFMVYGEYFEFVIEVLGEGVLDVVVDELLERATAFKYVDALSLVVWDDVEVIEWLSKRLKLFL